MDSEKIITKEYLLSIGFDSTSSGTGWKKFVKNGFELVEIPLKNGGFVFGFEFICKSQSKYKYPIKVNELNQLYKILTDKEL